MGLGGLLVGRGAFERAPGLREEDVVERRLVQLEVRHRDPGGVERPHDVGELRRALAQTHRGGAATPAAGLAERRERRLGRGRLGIVGGDHLDGRQCDLGLQLAWRALGDDPATVDDADAVGQRVGLLEVLRGQEDGHALVAGEPCDLLPERRARLRVEARRRLVEKQDPRPVQQRERQVEAPLHAARVAGHAPVGGLGETDALEQLVAPPRGARAFGMPCRPGLQPQVLAPGQHRVERDLLERRADRRAHGRALAQDVVAGDAGAAGGRRQQRREHLDRRRLAGAVRPEEPVDLAGLDHAGRSRRRRAGRP